MGLLTEREKVLSRIEDVADFHHIVIIKNPNDTPVFVISPDELSGSEKLLMPGREGKVSMSDEFKPEQIIIETIDRRTMPGEIVSTRSVNEGDVLNHEFPDWVHDHNGTSITGGVPISHVKRD